MALSQTKSRLPMAAALTEIFGFAPLLATIVALFIIGLCAGALTWLVLSAPPRTLTITSGPKGSSFQRYAESYRKALATHGVTLHLRESGGSLDNLHRLSDPASGVDIGFVQGGLASDGEAPPDLVALGSVAYQPLWLFYRGTGRISRLSELAGKRIGVGAPGSGTHALATALLKANGVTDASSTWRDSSSESATADLLAGRLDAVFLMGDSASIQTLRTLVRAPDIQLFHFVQADAYVRRLANLYLNKIELPQGSIDFGANLPAQDVDLVGPTVELVARRGLNSAISDLLLEVAKEVHGKAGLLQKRGEFPAPLEHDFPLSDDAQRYYKSGKGFLYRTIRSFWLASLVNRLLVVIVPLFLVLIPTLRFLPVVYKWSIQLRIYRCYRPLLRLERDAQLALSDERRAELLSRLDEIERTVNGLRVPASFAYQFYALRGHVAFVRSRVKAAAPAVHAG